MLLVGHDRAVYGPVDEADQASSRPDFAALVSPVVTMMDGPAHQGSPEALPGADPTEEAKLAYSPQMHVTSDAPETFLVRAYDDTAVVPDNSILFYQALRAARVKSELHIFRDGGHGFGIRGADELPVQQWPALLSDWMDRIGMTGGQGR